MLRAAGERAVNTGWTTRAGRARIASSGPANRASVASDVCSRPSPTNRGPVTPTSAPTTSLLRAGRRLSRWALARYIVGRVILERVSWVLLVAALAALALAAVSEWVLHSTLLAVLLVLVALGVLALRGLLRLVLHRLMNTRAYGPLEKQVAGIVNGASRGVLLELRRVGLPSRLVTLPLLLFRLLGKRRAETMQRIRRFEVDRGPRPAATSCTSRCASRWAARDAARPRRRATPPRGRRRHPPRGRPGARPGRRIGCLRRAGRSGLVGVESPGPAGARRPPRGVHPRRDGVLRPADGRFLVITVVLGIVSALAVWFLRPMRGVAATLGLVVGGLVGSSLTLLVGHLTGGGDATGRAINGSADRFSDQLPLTVHAHGLLVLQPAVSALVLGLLVAFAVRDDLGRPDPVRDAVHRDPGTPRRPRAQLLR